VDPPASLLDPTKPSALNTNFNQGFADSDSILLPDGSVMISPVLYKTANQTLIYNPFANTWTAGPTVIKNQDEATWVKLPDDSILTIDPTTNANELNSSERYIPSLNIWTNDATLTVPMFNSAQEIGAGIMLPDGRALFLGGLGHTAYYTPTGNNSPGVWSQGPELISPGVGWDEPIAMMVNGKVLIQTTCNPPPTPHYCFYELDPIAGTVVPAIDLGDTSGSAHTMLDLPDGNVLVCNGTSTVRIYIPDGVPVPVGKPTITSITPNGNGSYHLTGTKLNGFSQGSSFGDDVQMDSNYPLIRVNDGSGNLTYLPTFNWSSTSIRTGGKLVSTEFFPYQNLAPALLYSLVAVANGISSDPVTFYGPVWVDLNSGDPTQVGSFDDPFHTFAQGVNAVPNTGTLNLKTSGSSSPPITITKPMSIVAIGGPVTIGH
jgi:hypothetical protein